MVEAWVAVWVEGAMAEATAEAMVEARVAVSVDTEAADMVGPAGMAVQAVVVVHVLGRSLG
jgi:hypothetical protein